MSIITTFTTPYLIKLAEPAYGFVQRLLPQTVTRRLEQRGAALEKQKSAHPWKNMLTSQLIITGAYLVLSAAFVTISFSTVLPLSRGIFGHWAGNILSGIITYVGVSIFLRPIVTKKYFFSTGGRMAQGALHTESHILQHHGAYTLHHCHCWHFLYHRISLSATVVLERSDCYLPHTQFCAGEICRPQSFRAVGETHFHPLGAHLHHQSAFA